MKPSTRRCGSSRGAASDYSRGWRPWFEFAFNEPRSGDRIFRRSAAHLPSDIVTTAFSRGFGLTPLRGW